MRGDLPATFYNSPPGGDPPEPDAPTCPDCDTDMIRDVDDVDEETGHVFWSWSCPNDSCDHD